MPGLSCPLRRPRYMICTAAVMIDWLGPRLGAQLLCDLANYTLLDVTVDLQVSVGCTAGFVGCTAVLVPAGVVSDTYHIVFIEKI